MAKEKEGALLVVDDNRSILAAVQLLMGNYFARVLTLPTPNQLMTTLRREPVDVILLDMNFSAGINTGNEGFYWLQEIHRNYPDIKVVLFTAYADIDLAVRAMRDGAVDFVVKPWDNERLVAALQGAYNLSRSQREVKQLKEIKRELTADTRGVVAAGKLGRKRNDKAFPFLTHQSGVLLRRGTCGSGRRFACFHLGD